MSGRTETASSSVFMEEEDEPKEWVAQVEPGVLITFLTLPQGGNDLKRIRFRYAVLFRLLFLRRCFAWIAAGVGVGGAVTGAAISLYLFMTEIWNLR